MIFDSLAHINQYKTTHPGIYKALTILRDTDFSKMEDATVEVEGRDLYYFLQSYETKEENNTPEAHRKYADIQAVLVGAEKIGVGALEDMTQEVSAKPENDIWFYNGPMDYVTLTPGKFAVLFPGDAHAPGICLDAPAQARKCVFKVRL